MNFHAARVAPEKAVFRPALPMCFIGRWKRKQSALDAGCSLDAMKAEAKVTGSWTRFQNWLDT